VRVIESAVLVIVTLDCIEKAHAWYTTNATKDGVRYKKVVVYLDNATTHLVARSGCIGQF